MQMMKNDDAEYEEENIGYPVSSVSNNSHVYINQKVQETFIKFAELLCAE